MIATVALLAAAGGRGHDDFLAGLLIGAATGLLLGPVFRSWLVWREREDESRRDRLTDQVLARMERELASPASLAAAAVPDAPDAPDALGADEPLEGRWGATPGRTGPARPGPR